MRRVIVVALAVIGLLVSLPAVAVAEAPQPGTPPTSGDPNDQGQPQPGTGQGDCPPVPVAGCNPNPPPDIPDDIKRKLIGPMILMKGSGKQGRSHIDPVYSDVAARLAGVPSAEVRCWAKADWNIMLQFVGPGVLGFVLPDLKINVVNGDFGFAPTNKIHLDPGVCARLDLMVHQHKLPRGLNVMKDMAEAVMVLTHESQHVGGAADESQAQCLAVSKVEAAALDLGLPKAYAAKLARLARHYVNNQLPMAYQGRCPGT